MTILTSQLVADLIHPRDRTFLICCVMLSIIISDVTLQECTSNELFVKTTALKKTVIKGNY